MNIQEINRYCGLFAQRLKGGERVSIEQFLEENGLPRDEELLAELIRLERECSAAAESVGDLQSAVETTQPQRPLAEASAETTARQAPVEEPFAETTARQAPVGEPSAETTEGQGRLGVPSVETWDAPPAENLGATQEWGLEDKWTHAAAQSCASITTSLKAAVSADPASEISLVIQRRSVRQPHASSHEPADYDLLDMLGKGGMGTVYAARQASIDRTVAVKMIIPKAASDAEARNTFLAEACITGDLEHPNIVPIYDLARNEQGAFFYAMKRVQGTPWADVIQDNTLHENIDILMNVCDAVAFAHSKGVVHRDLKPANVMLGDFGEVLVMDWGLAIATNGRGRFGGIKQSANFSGTPAYMAPEMAKGPIERIGPASDIYLLGAILYEIATGLRPHRGKNALACLYAAAANVIEPTEKTGELIDIALKAMASQPEDRYPSVQAFQDAIREYQSHSESITLAARSAEHLAKANQSHDYDDYSRAMFGFQQAVELWDGNEQAKSGLAETKLAYAACAKTKADYELGAGLLDVALPEHAALFEEITAAQRERDSRQRRLRTYKKVGVAMAALLFLVISGAAFWINRARHEAVRQREETDRQRVIAVNSEAEAKRQRKEADKQRDLARGNEAEANRQRVIAVNNEAEAKRQRKEADKQRDLARDSEAKAIAARKAEAQQAYVARIGAAAARIDENAYDHAADLLEQCIPDDPDQRDHRNWEWGRLLHLCRQASKTFRTDAPLESVACALGPGGAIEKFAGGGGNGRAHVWGADGAKLADINADAQTIHALAFSPDGQHIAAGTSDENHPVKIFNARTGELETRLADPDGPGHARPVLSVQYSGDGRRLLTGSRDGTAKIWSLENGRVLATLHGHRWWVWQAKFFPAGDPPRRETKLVTVSQDGAAIVWSDETGKWENLAGVKQSEPFREHEGPVYAVAVSPDGTTIATAGHDKRVLLWKPEDLRKFDYDRALQAPLDEPIASDMKYRPLIGHTAAVRSLAFSRNGRLLISAGHDNVVKVWAVESGQLLKTLRGHGQWVRSCAISADGRSVLSAGFDQTARLWDIEGYEEVRVLRGKVLEGHDDSILDAAFSADNESIVTASRDRTIKTWDSKTGDAVRDYYEGHSFLATNAALFPDGKRLATGAADDTVRIWDVESGAELHVLRNTGRSAVVAVSPDGKRVLTGGPKAETGAGEPQIWLAQLWNADSGELVQKLQRHAGQVFAAAFSPDGQFLYTGDFTGRGMLWDAHTGQFVRDLKWHRAKIIGAKFLDDNRTLVTASIEQAVARWDFRRGEVDEQSILRHPSSIVSMDADPIGRYVVTSCTDNVVRLWDCQSGQVIQALGGSDGGKAGAITKVALSPDRRYVLAVNCQQRTVRIYDASSGREIEYPQTAAQKGPFLKLSERSQLWSATFARDGQCVVTAGGDQVRLWDLNEDLPQFRRLRMDFSPHGVVASARFSTDGKEIVSGSWDGTAIIWSRESGKPRRKLTGRHLGRVNCALFSPDGKSSFVLTAADDRTAVLWNAHNGDFIRRFVGHTGRVLSAAFSSDVQRVLTAGDDGTVRIWDINNGREPIQTLQEGDGAVLQAAFSSDAARVVIGRGDNLAVIRTLATGQSTKLEGHTAAVNSVAFSRDGQRVLTGSDDFTAKIWDANTGKELLTLKGHQREVTSVSFSPNELYVLTGSHDGTAMIWTAAPWNQKKAPSVVASAAIR